jgi:hypothetical protein
VVGGAGAVVFIREHAGLEPGGTNRKAGSGWGRFRVQKQVVEGEIYKCRVRVGSHYLAGLAWFEVTLLCVQ